MSDAPVCARVSSTAGKGAYWCMKLQEASATFVQLRAEEEAAERLSMDEGDDTIVERKSLDIKFRHWWWKFFKKFRGQKGTPPGVSVVGLCCVRCISLSGSGVPDSALYLSRPWLCPCFARECDGVCGCRKTRGSTRSGPSSGASW